ncbi:hypothetical protein KAV79_07640 [Candidatus Aerophobetes bacterium]|nr:hypothetical protein [Candidatus Aerophobetes bacterium]
MDPEGKMVRPAAKREKQPKRLVRGVLLVLFVLGGLFSLGEVDLVDSGAAKASEAPCYFILSVDSGQHNDYGFSYPVTYQFSIPSDSLNLEAYKKYAESGSWTKIVEERSTDFFNGIEAVRFDYPGNKAYISVAFSDASDEIFLKIVDELENPVATYEKITKYYDDREAAVVFSADDWDGDALH